MSKKNLYIKLAAMCSAAGLLLSACGGSSSASVDASALANSLKSDGSFTSELNEENASDYLTVEDGVESVMYMSTGSYEEVAVFTAPDSETALTVKGDVMEFLNEQKTAAEDYEPEAAKRIDDAVLVVNGNYVVLCVSADSAKAQEIIDKAFK